MTEAYITEVSEEIEGSATEKLFQEFIRTELCILGALSKLDEFLLNPQVRTCSGTVPGTSRNNDFENREPTGDRSQNDPYPEVELSIRQASNTAYSEQEETAHSYEKNMSTDDFYRSYCTRELKHFILKPLLLSKNIPFLTKNFKCVENIHVFFST